MLSGSKEDQCLRRSALLGGIFARQPRGIELNQLRDRRYAQARRRQFPAKCRRPVDHRFNYGHGCVGCALLAALVSSPYQRESGTQRIAFPCDDALQFGCGLSGKVATKRTKARSAAERSRTSRPPSATAAAINSSSVANPGRMCASFMAFPKRESWVPRRHFPISDLSAENEAI